jgi:hypothetical protein
LLIIDADPDDEKQEWPEDKQAQEEEPVTQLI